MPELPEVETIVQSIKPKIIGRKIKKVVVSLEKMVKHPDLANFRQELQGKTIVGLRRWGKYVIIDFQEDLVLLLHLRMTGQLLCVSSEAPKDRHVHAVFYLNDGKELWFRDIRTFGTMHLYPAASPLETLPPLVALGTDALDPDLTLDAFKKRLKKTKGQAKKVLLDQSIVAGIGNIYADEILWEAGIHPEKDISSLNSRQQEKIYSSMREILQRAIAHRGTTIRDYLDADGRPGTFQHLLQVHGKEREKCPRCGAIIERIKVAGRSSYYCPCCQNREETDTLFTP